MKAKTKKQVIKKNLKIEKLLNMMFIVKILELLQFSLNPSQSFEYKCTYCFLRTHNNQHIPNLDLAYYNDDLCY